MGEVGRILPVCSSVLLLCGCQGGQPNDSAQFQPASHRVQVQVAEVRRADISSTLELVGNFLPQRRTVIVAEVDGVIKRIPHSKQRIEVAVDGRGCSQPVRLGLGHEVSEGDILIELDPVDFELALASAQAKLDRANKELEQLLAWKRPEEVQRIRALRDEAKAHLDQAESELKRAESLGKEQALSRSDYEHHLAVARRARAMFAHADAAWRIALAGPTNEEIAVAKAKVAELHAEVQVQAEKLKKATIRAPYDAVITDRYVDEGDRVTALPRVEIMEIMDLSLVVAQVAVPERYIHRVKIGEMTRVKAKGVVEPVPGVVVLINDKVEPETRTYRVRVAVENSRRIFKAGQFVEVAFLIGSSSDTLQIPSPAISYSGGQPVVFVYGDRRVCERPVKLGISNEEQTEVLSGLSEGEQVVVVDPSVLAHGMTVELPSAAGAEGGEQRP